MCNLNILYNTFWEMKRNIGKKRLFFVRVSRFLLFLFTKPDNIIKAKGGMDSGKKFEDTVLAKTTKRYFSGSMVVSIDFTGNCLVSDLSLSAYGRIEPGVS